MSSLLLTALLAGAPLQAPAPADEERVRSEIEFARGLAARWQFVDLATDVLDDLESGDLDRDLEVLVALARCQVLAEGARWERELAARQRLYEQALDAYAGFIDLYGDSEQADEAKRAYVNLAATYARVMEEVLAETAGEEADVLRAGLTSRLTEVVGYTSEQISALSAIPIADITPSESRQLRRLQLSRGELLLALAKVSDDPEYFLQEAEAALESLVGGTDGEALIASIVLGDVYAEREDLEFAGELYLYVIDGTIPLELEAWLAKKRDYELAPANVDALWYYVELATYKAIESFQLAGDRETALEIALHFVNTWSAEGLSLRPYGYLSMLAVAGALMDAGGYVGGSLADGDLAWFESPEAAREGGFSPRTTRSAMELALTLAGRVNEDNPGSVLQRDAQRLIADAVDQPGVVVSSDVLYEAALGDFNAHEYEDALDSLRRVKRTLADEAQRTTFMPKVQYHVGLCFYRQDRFLEAAYAFREGVSPEWQGDQEYDSQNAAGFYNSMKRVRRAAPDDPQLEALFTESEVVQQTVNTEDAGDIRFRNGVAQMEAGNHEQARELFLQVPPEAFSHEPAKVKAAVCLYELDRYEEAEAELRAYLEKFVEDPRNKLSGGDVNRQRKRTEARAEGNYFLGMSAFDQGEWRLVIDRLRNFPDEFSSQPGLCAAALGRSLEAYLELGDVEAAKSVHEQMVRNYPEDPFTGAGASKIYNRLLELLAEAKEGGDRAAIEAVDRQLAEYARIANQLSSHPTFNALRQESVHWMDVGEWEEAEQVLKRLVGMRDESPQVARQVEKFVLPDLGTALLRQLRPQDAYDALAPLVPDLDDEEDDRKPSEETVTTWCKSVTGILVGDPDAPEILPGVGGVDNFDQVVRWWDKIANSQENWLSAEWYESKFQLAWAQYQWGQEDSAKIDSARRTLNTIRAETSGFRDIEEWAGPEVRRRYEWLWDRVQ